VSTSEELSALDPAEEPHELPDPDEEPQPGGEPVLAASAPNRNPVARALAWCRQNLAVAAAVGLVLVSAVAAASVYWWLYRPDRLTDAAGHLDADLSNAKSHLTGEFLSYYTDFTDKVVAPASRDKGVKTEANVARAAVSEMRPEKADVLVFVNQVTTSKERPTPALSTSSVMVTLVRSDGRWLISAFNPV
jgi:Mce-associated membrane protein